MVEAPPGCRYGGEEEGCAVPLHPAEIRPSVRSLLMSLKEPFRSKADRHRSGGGRPAGREAVLSGILSALPEVLYVIDLDGWPLEWNDRANEVTGYTDQEIEQQHIFGFVPRRHHGRIAAALEAIRQGQDPVTVEAAVLTREGNEIPYELAGAGVRDEEGNLVAIVGIGRDITDRRHLEEEKREVSRQERRWLAQELHDGTCQQLSTLSVRVATLRLHLTDSSEHVQCHLDRIDALLDRTIQHTRALSYGIMPLDFEALDVKEALRDLTLETCPAYAIDCTFEADGELTVASPETAMNLYRIAQEALRNAIRHGEPGRISMVLRREKEVVVLRVEDDGVGIQEARQQNELCGLGLKTMQDRAHIMGGTLTVTSGEEGRGTVVTCTIPFARTQPLP